MQIPTATPRRLVNHRDVSATRGANVAEVPNKPINKPFTKLKQPIQPDKPAATSPALKQAVPTATQVAPPNRSDNHHITLPPRRSVERSVGKARDRSGSIRRQTRQENTNTKT